MWENMCSTGNYNLNLPAISALLIINRSIFSWKLVPQNYGYENCTMLCVDTELTSTKISSYLFKVMNVKI